MISSGTGGLARAGQSHSPIPVDKLWKLQQQNIDVDSPVVKQLGYTGSNRKPSNATNLVGSRPYGRDDIGNPMLNPLTTYGGSKNFLGVPAAGPWPIG